MKRVHLPRVAGAARESALPSVDDVRRGLGGRASTGDGAGETVELEAGPLNVIGVVLFARGEEVHVLTGSSTIRKTTRRKVTPIDASQSAELGDVARDARTFGCLREGDRVCFVDPVNGSSIGTLVEKCRYGALVKRDDETIIGVGFRKVRPNQSSPEVTR